MSIIKSLCDLDFYKLTTSQFAYHQFPAAVTRFKFKNRSRNVNLKSLAPEVRKHISALRDLFFTESEIERLRVDGRLSSDYLDALANLRLDPDRDVIISTDDGDLSIEVKGTWWIVTLYEIYVLAIVQECYSETVDVRTPIEANSRLRAKIDMLNDNPGVKVTEFGTRRRDSYAWQKHVIQAMWDLKAIVATSNVHFAQRFGIPCVGTFPHESLMVLQGCKGAPRLIDFQKEFLWRWHREFDGRLGIALSDVVGFDAFLRDFGHGLANAYTGCRHDSGDPFSWCVKLINHYEKLGIDPKTKVAMFSDGLDIPKAIGLYNEFGGRINTSFGIGTDLTNSGLGYTPLQIVMKVVEVDGMAVAKISDSPGKEMCEDIHFVTYLKHVFRVS